MADKTVFETLNNINVNDKTEKKGNLTYLSWAWAWSEVKKMCPDATYKILRDENGLPYFKEPDVGYMCMTEVTINGETLMMWLPVMDFKNKAILNPSMFDINKTIMRCLTKNLAMFGLGLYIYAGEDLPEEEDGKTKTNHSNTKSDDTPIKDLQEAFKGLLQMLEQRGVTDYWDGVKSMYSVEKVEDLAYADLKSVGEIAKNMLMEIDKKKK